MIETANMVIRRFRESDLGNVHQFLSDPAVMVFSRMELFSLLQTRAWLFDHIASYPHTDPLGVFALVLKSSGTVIGYCGLEELPPEIADEVEMTVGLGSDYWGRGFATEAAYGFLDYAFDQCWLDRVVAVIHADNRKARKLVARIGFQLQRDLLIKDVGEHVLYSLEPADLTPSNGGMAPE